MIAFFNGHPYLFSGLLGLAVVFGGYIFAGNQRQAMVVSGLTLIPLAPLAVFHEAVYWSPTRLLGGPIGIEDVIFLFQAGTMTWLLSVWAFRHRIRVTLSVSQIARRAVALAALGVALLLFLLSFGLDIMTSSLVGIMIVAVGVLIWRPSLWPLAPAGALAYSTFYLLFLNFSFWIWPDLISYWNPASAWSRLVLGIPVGELAFAVVLGAAYPICMGFYLDAVLGRGGRGTSRSAVPDSPAIDPS